MAPQPDLGTVRAAIELACRAPSVHNTQPWRWLLGERSIHLLADRSRQLPATDPEGRDLLISCGAALHHLRVALAGFGWSSSVQYCPDRTDRDRIAVVTTRPSTPTAEAVELGSALRRRRADRRVSAPWAVPYSHLDLLTVAAQRAAPVRLLALRDARSRMVVTRALADAAARQDADVACRAEVAAWSGRHPDAPDGVLADSALAAQVAYGDTAMRYFARGTLPVAEPRATVGDFGQLLAITTAADDARHWVHAGEAASALMLTATTLGLASCPLSQATETSATRSQIGDRLLGGRAVAQLLVRVAWVSEEDSLPVSPRRPLDDVVDSLADAPLARVR